MTWSPTAWLVSIAAVIISGAVAWAEGNWRRREGLQMGFANHGGMWSDLLLLPIANTAIIPHLTVGPWLGGALITAACASLWVHRHWYRGATQTRRGSPLDTAMPTLQPHTSEHMWPIRQRGTWHGDLSVAGWLHVLYVTGELIVLAGYLIYPMPLIVIVLVTMVFSVHVPIGLLQPRWFVSGDVPAIRRQPLLLPLLALLWVVAAAKLSLGGS